ATVVGGGSGKGLVFCNGTNWLFMGSNTAIAPPAGAGASGNIELSAGTTSAMSSFTPGSGVVTFLTTPSLANLSSAVTGGTLTQTIASGTSALGTSSISTASCATVVTTSATGVASTDAIIWVPNGSIKAVTGYVRLLRADLPSQPIQRPTM